ncbi:MAG: ATP-dependent RNA helicase HrpA [Burkholderiaceae bacterium]
MSDPAASSSRRRRPRRRPPGSGRAATEGVAAYVPGPLPALNLPEALPVSGERDRIVAALREHPVVIVCGETGSGKTTQLPKLCALAGRGESGRIGHTQPRRLAASSVARRIAEELGTPLGQDVGFKVRFDETISPGARFKLMTDGILLAETLGDPDLLQYDTLIVDEAHERSLNIDFLLGYLKRLIDGRRRDSLKLVITSATIDAQRFAEHFSSNGRPAPVIEVSGRVYPVAIRYLPPEPQGREPELAEQIENALEALWAQAPGDVLVFLPGEREIRETAQWLERRRARAGAGRFAQIEVLPLFARLSVAEQQRVFARSNGFRVVLATNVAETSLTVPGIRYVVDSGLARVKRYRVRSKVEQLQIEPVSRAAADQRAGRCGRVADGIAIRLYAQDDYEQRPAYTDPELLRSSLAGVILRMMALRLGDPASFPFIDPPVRAAINDGFALLAELGAVDDQRRLTQVGRQLSRLPVDPCIGRMLLAAHERHCLREVLVIAAFLSAQDPRERPLTAQQAADQAHKAYEDPRSDFSAVLKLWEFWQGLQNERRERETTRRELQRRLGQVFLSERRLREWGDVEQQLREQVRELGWRLNEQPVGEDALHQALLTGLLGNLGFKPPDEATYQGTHLTRFTIHPSSGMRRRAPRWLMAAEMVDTGRLYARTVAAIQPGWIETAARHLIRRSWSDPIWSSKSGQAFCYERGVLYGLPVYVQRRVPLAPRDPAAAREMFIRCALVQDDWSGAAGDRPFAFAAHNRKLIASIRRLEERIRRPDLLVDESFLLAWFDARLPADVADPRQLRAWLDHGGDEATLKLTRDALLRKQAEGVRSEAFPPEIEIRGVRYSLEYRFEPGEADDGVSLVLPLALLNQIDPRRCEWLIPGLLAEKVQALLKRLPQRMRRHLVPIPEWAARFADENDPPPTGVGLIDALRQTIRERHGVDTQESDFRADTIPAHLFLNYRLMDAHGRRLGQGRHLQTLRSEHGEAARGAFREAFAAVADQFRSPRSDEPVHDGPAAAHSGRGAATGESLPGGGREGSGSPAAGPDAARSRGPVGGPVPALGGGEGGEPAPAIVDGRLEIPLNAEFRRWPVDALPELLEISVPGAASSMIGFPAFVDTGDAIRIEVFDEEPIARQHHRAGVRRLLTLTLRDAFKALPRHVPDAQRLVIAYARIDTDAALWRDFAQAVLVRAIGEGAEPTSRASFETLVAQVRPRLSLIAAELGRTLEQVLDDYAAALRKLQSVAAGAREPHVQAAVDDIREQLSELVGPRFLAETPPDAFGQLGRYLRAIVLRLERVRADPARVEQQRREHGELQMAYRKLRRARRGMPDAELDRFRWLLEELRVSMYAQGLRTPMPVSVKRLRRMLEGLHGN